MQRTLQIPLVLAVLASSVAGQASDTSAIILARKPEQSTAPPARPAERAAPSGIEAAMSSVMPAYAPPAAAPAPVDLRERDRPRNQIPRLPAEMMQKYVVHEGRIPVFRTLDLYTKEALTDIGFKEHPGLRFGNIFNLNAPAAHAAAVNAARYAERVDLVDTSFAMAAEGDRTEIEAMQQAIIDDGFNRESPVGR